MRRPRSRKNAALAWMASLTVAGTLALALLLLGSGHSPRAAAAGSPPELFPSTDVAVPAENVVMLGASTSEPGAPGGATWGLGALEEAGHSTSELVRYTAPSAGGQEGGWEPGPELPNGFEPDQPNNKPSPLVGQVTSEGYGELAGTIPGEKEPTEKRQVVLVRKPGTGEAFQETPPVPVESETEAKEKEGEGKEGEGGEEPLRLKKGQMLFGSDRAPMIAPLAESNGAAGALVAPTNPSEGVAEAVLHWDGERWECEPIAIPEASAKEFNVLAIAASGPENAWLLARLANAYGAGTGAVALFRRVKEAGGKACGKETGDGYSWQQVEVEVGPGEVKLPLSVPVSAGAPAAGEPFGVVGAETPEITVESQLLTVTGEGVWVDGVRTDAEHHQPFTTMYLRPERRGEGKAAKEVAVVARSWCNAAPEKPPCQETLPQEPPLQYGRSIAWSGSGPYGQRVITGLFEGVTLRLQGGAFAPVLSIGGGEQPETVPGKLYGAAFGSPSEGWLGYQVPVHLTTSQEPDGLGYWPVATRDALLAVAPEPGAPVAALASEALAVGEHGSVARYKPGAGWLPESLFGPGERIETPNLRAVAWPRSNRVYAVGEEGAMWLWRGETGLWEPDPATPINFRANLYGIAFDPEEPARGYAVGTQFVGGGGVILRYGKTWTEETTLPEAVKNAQFTGIAFAGSEALVAYNLQTNIQESNSPFKGGLLVNDGGGWSIDSEERQVTGGARVQAVAALPDGGAAVLAGEGSVRLYERESAGAPWRQAATPLPGGVSGSLALYRENGALRALVSAGGAADVGRALDDEPPPGIPPYLTVRPSVSAGSGAMLRQTADGWSDERRDIDPVEQSGLYSEYDEPYRPDPLIAALVSPSGSEAWVVGGITGEKEGEQTADVARYPATGRPPHEGTLPVPVAPEAAGPGGSGGVTTLAFGGGANCAAPCAARARDGIGPEVWLTSAVSLAQRAGASAFFYTGPMVHYSSYSGQQVPPPPFAEEYARYAGLFGGGLPSWPVYTAEGDGELVGEPALAGAFGGLASPLGATPASGWAPAGPALSPAERETCDCAGDYYAVKNEHVRVVLLDDAAGDVDAAQRVWLEQQLQEAGREGKPAIVVAEADLGAQLAPGKHDELAEALFAALTGRDPDGQDPGGYAASAYFYDAPEKNVSKTVSFAGASLHVIGSGTLGYELQANENTTEFHGAKGVVFGEVQWSETGAADRAPVQARLVPVVGEVAMESAGGALLRRSHVSLFKGLARTPRAGCRGNSGEGQCEEGHYVPVPSVCVGVTCAEAVLPEYEFRSSEPAVGGFVKLNTAAGGLPTLEQEKGEPSAFVLLNGKDEPVADGHEEHGEQVGATSGLFCAYNAGETNVTIVAGGLSYTLPVTVQPGSVRRPCGTVPLRHFPVAAQSPSAPVPPLAPAPAPAGPSPAATPPVVPVPPTPPPATTVPAPPARPVPAPPPFFVAAVTPFLPIAFVPPPLPAPAEPTPPTGTSAVTSPVEAAQKEEEEEEATESVSNQALAYHPAEHDPAPEYVLGLALLAAFAGASTVRRRPRRGRRGVKVAAATLPASRSQQRMSRDGRRSR